MKVKGRIIAVTDAQTGTSDKGEWAKRTIVVSDENGEYPNKFVLNLFKSGEHIEFATTKFNYAIDEMVEVEYSVRANEYKGKWYGDNSIFRIDKVGVIPAEPVEDGSDEPPF